MVSLIITVDLLLKGEREKGSGVYIEHYQIEMSYGYPDLNLN